MKKGYNLLICCILLASYNAQQQKLRGFWSLQDVQIPTRTRVFGMDEL